MLARAACLLVALAVVWGSAPAAVRALPSAVGEDRDYTAAPEENLYTIARRFGLAAEHLAFANGIRPLRLAVAPGTRLRIPLRRILPRDPPRDGIVVNLPERGLYLFAGGRLVRFYAVAIGMPGRFSTPRGAFRVLNRARDPVWIPPAWAAWPEERVPPGPENPLGDRWLGITGSGVGIHSTNNPVWIGGAVSHACLRLYPEMARDLYRRVRVGTSVRIEYEPVKVGPSCMAVFADVYGLRDPLNEARRKLRSAGYAMAEEELRRRVDRGDGIAAPISN